LSKYFTFLSISKLTDSLSAMLLPVIFIKSSFKLDDFDFIALEPYKILEVSLFLKLLKSFTSNCFAL